MAPRVVILSLVLAALAGGSADATRLISRSSVGATKKGRPTFRAEMRPEVGQKKGKKAKKAPPVAIVELGPKETRVGYELRALGEGQRANLSVVSPRVSRLTVSSEADGHVYETTWVVHHGKRGRHRATAAHKVDGAAVGTESVKLARHHLTYAQR